MKHILIVVFLLGTQAPLLSQKNYIIYPGYLIKAGNDTLITKIAVDHILGHVEFSSLYTGFIYIDKDNHLDTVNVDNSKIVGFGFKKDSINYDFTRITFFTPGQKKEYAYLWRILDGHVKLYLFGYDDRFMSHGLVNKNLKYYLQKGDSDIVAIPKKQKNLFDKNWLKKFFKDYKSLSKEIGNEIEIYDIETMVKRYNVWFQSNISSSQ